MINVFKAICGFALLAVVMFLLGKLAYTAFFVAVAIVAVLVKWALVAFMIFLAFAVIVGMIQALIKG